MTKHIMAGKKEKRLVSVCIPSLNTLGYLKDCIEALKNSTKGIPIEILVLDLGDDGTYEWCQENKIKVWKKALPFYFAQSNNFLASKAKGDVLLFLNSDTLPKRGFLGAMLEEMDGGADIVGCLMIYPNNIVQHAGIKWKGLVPTRNSLPDHIGYEKPFDIPEFHTAYDTQAVTGACMLVKTHVFKHLGGFDEQFRNCYEDIDLCIKARIAGYKIRYTGKGIVAHYVSGSKGTDGKSATTGQFMDESVTKLLTKYPSQPHQEEDGKIKSVDIQPEGYMSTIVKNNTVWQHRILIGTPTTGTVRMEWVFGRYGQVIPTNWSNVDMVEWTNAYAPLEYLVPDAQNLIVKKAVEDRYEWVLLFEQDNIPLPDAFIRLNDYIMDGSIPVVSGLYFTKSVPPEPILYRGRGNSYFDDWKIGDKVWVDGVPTGFLLINTKILQAMWNDSPEYMCGGIMTRRVFECPRKYEVDQFGNIMTSTGTSDLAWCTRVMNENYLEKAGFGEFAKEHKDAPFLCDTNIFLWHIDPNGRKYPIGGVPGKYKPHDKRP